MFKKKIEKKNPKLLDDNMKVFYNLIKIKQFENNVLNRAIFYQYKTISGK